MALVVVLLLFGDESFWRGIDVPFTANARWKRRWGERIGSLDKIGERYLETLSSFHLADADSPLS